MKPGLAAPLLLALSPVAAAAQEDAALQHARELLKHTILIDGHNDLPWTIRESKTAPRDVDAYDLRVKTIMVDEGPALKRFMARAKGRGTRILKRTSHITVVVGAGK